MARAYGADPAIPAPSDDLPLLPPPRIQRAVNCQLAAFQFWMVAGRSAREPYQQRHPHALPSLTRLARLMELAFDFKKLALGLDSPNPLPGKITYDCELTDLKRAYGDQDPSPGVKTVPGNAAPPHGLLTCEHPKPAFGP